MRSSIKPFLRYTEAPTDGGGGGADGSDTATDPQAPAAGTEPQEGDDTDGDDTEDDGDDLQEIDKKDAWDPDRALKKIKKLNAEVRSAKERLEKAAQDESNAAKKVPTLEAEILRLRVALKHGLPEKIANRLQGETEEELLADAQELLETFSPKRPPSQRPNEALRGGTNPTREGDDVDIDKLVLSQLTS